MEKIRWTELALEDLRAIHEYISKDSIIYADKFIEKLLLRIEQLETHENSGRIVPEFENETIRELIEGNYRIIYKLAMSQVFIVRLHHAAQLLRVV